MPSLKEVRDILLISHFQGVINDEEFLLLYDLDRSTNLDLPYEYYDSFDFDLLQNNQLINQSINFFYSRIYRLLLKC